MSMRPSCAWLRNVKFVQYTFVLDIRCQQLGNVSQLDTHIGTGYILPTNAGICMLEGICKLEGVTLCALEAQGLGECTF